ncbi:GspH/FimT family pseudopilin [Congregibacter sp.]|uniref:GspH/FimT family pseudopilin n=1 Tax=Congregibacter sp. TaxID=2744308 RepID=UPI003F6C5B9E
MPSYSRQPYKNPRGFTLLELLIVASLLAIFLSLGLPAMDRLQVSLAIRSDASRLVSSLKTARSHAVLNRVDVTICPATHSENAENIEIAHASACGGDYKQGWLVFEDSDGDGDFTFGVDHALRREGALQSQVQIRNRDGEHSLTSGLSYRASGYVVPGKTFVVCAPGAIPRKSWLVVVSGVGRVRSAVEHQRCVV